VEAEDVGAEAAGLVEEMDAEAGTLHDQRFEGFADGGAADGEEAFAVDHLRQHGGELHGDLAHVVRARTR
jgi:hypothetical protein